MAQSSDRTSLVARRYAGALIASAAAQNALPEVESDVVSLAAAMAATPEFARLLANPRLGAGQQAQLVAGVGGHARFHALTGRFLAVLARNRRLSALPEILVAAQSAFAARRGTQTAEVRSAVALSPEQTQMLQDKIAQTLGHAVTLNVTVDRSLLGGLVVTVGSKQIDDSVKHKLDRLARAMTAPANANTTQPQKELG